MIDLQEDRGGTIVKVCIFSTALTSIVVPLRFFVRASVVKSVGWDDWTILAAAVLAVALNAVTILSVKYGAGRHMKAISADNFMLAMKCNYIMQVITIYCLLFVKVSICLFIARLGPRPIYKKICYGTATILTVYTIASGFTIIFQCIPIEKTWNRGGVQGTCFPSTTMVGLAYAHTAVSVFTDFFLVFLPAPIVWKVQIPTRQKVILTIVLALGLFASVAGSVKFHYLIDYGKTGDYLWDITDLTIWAIIEILVGTICTCIPALKPLFKRCLSRGISSYDRHIRGSKPSDQTPSGPKTTIYVGTRRMAKEPHESEESIFSKGDIELGIRVTQELGVRISENRGVSMERGRVLS